MSRLVVAISHVEVTEADQTLYVIKVQQDADEWEVRRTYSDFRRLRDDVQRVMKDERHQVVDDDVSRVFARGVHDLPFPSKRLFGSKKDHVVKERAVELHQFLIKLLFLTHTYRKAQKARYEGTHVSGRPQGSVSAFYLLRDFLKPVMLHTGGRVYDDLGLDAHAEEEYVRSHMIRESKMLSMRTSQQTKAMSAPQLLHHHQPPAMSTKVDTHAQPVADHGVDRAPPPAPPAHPPLMVTVSKPTHASPVRSPPASKASPVSTTSKTLNIAALMGTNKTVMGSSNVRTNSSPTRRKTSDPTPKENVALEPRLLKSLDSDVNLIETVADAESLPLSNSSTASSSSLLSRPRSAGGSNASSTSRPRSAGSNASASVNASSSSATTRRRPRAKKKSSSSNLSKVEKDQRNSERISRLNPQLTAQTITVNAQKELERYVSEYNAIMILRYVDRFISKAVGKTPGCYTVSSKRIVIDSARFAEELDEVFSDLPSGFQAAFKNASGDWMFPKALDAYAQLKWNSFQGKTMTGNGSVLSNKNSDSEEESESEYEYESTGGYMKSHERKFTQEESDVLQMMIADGIATSDQALRLRRQFDEKGWHRRDFPGFHPKQNDSGEFEDEDVSDTDDDDLGSGNESATVKRFQEQMNRKRELRLSRRDLDGGLV